MIIAPWLYDFLPGTSLDAYRRVIILSYQLQIEKKKCVSIIFSIIRGNPTTIALERRITHLTSPFAMGILTPVKSNAVFIVRNAIFKRRTTNETTWFTRIPAGMRDGVHPGAARGKPGAG
jgi:hypothetical protein